MLNNHLKWKNVLQPKHNNYCAQKMMPAANLNLWYDNQRNRLIILNWYGSDLLNY